MYIYIYILATTQDPALDILKRWLQRVMYIYMWIAICCIGGTANRIQKWVVDPFGWFLFLRFCPLRGLSCHKYQWKVEWLSYSFSYQKKIIFVWCLHFKYMILNVCVTRSYGATWRTWQLPHKFRPHSCRGIRDLLRSSSLAENWCYPGKK